MHQEWQPNVLQSAAVVVLMIALSGLAALDAHASGVQMCTVMYSYV